MANRYARVNAERQTAPTPARPSASVNDRVSLLPRMANEGTCGLHYGMTTPADRSLVSKRAVRRAAAGVGCSPWWAISR